MWKRNLGYTLLALIVGIAAFLSYFYFRQPNRRAASDIHVTSSPQRIARGQYLYTLADCDSCHSKVDDSKLYRPVIDKFRGQGKLLDFKDLPGSVSAPNITTDRETGLGAWTDGEKLRAIREGIGRDGRALFPMMPYESFRYMSDEDVQCLIAYLNSLPPVRNSVERTRLNFPVSFLIKGTPQPVDNPIATPDPANQRVYGEYLATVGSCAVCHTPAERGSLDRSKLLAGGRNFGVGSFTVVSANITPDGDTGIGSWSLDYFKERFTRHRGISPENLPPVSKELFTVMPWINLAKLSDSDLQALYVYLREQRAVSNKVLTHPIQTAANVGR